MHCVMIGSFHWSCGSFSDSIPFDADFYRMGVAFKPINFKAIITPFEKISTLMLSGVINIRARKDNAKTIWIVGFSLFFGASCTGNR